MNAIERLTFEAEVRLVVSDVFAGYPLRDGESERLCKAVADIAATSGLTARADLAEIAGKLRQVMEPYGPFSELAGAVARPFEAAAGWIARVLS